MMNAIRLFSLNAPVIILMVFLRAHSIALVEQDPFIAMHVNWNLFNYELFCFF